MPDKRTVYSFLITIFIIFIIYTAVSADANSRSMGFGGEIPRYSTLLEEIIHSNDLMLYLYRNRTAIYQRFKRILPPEGMLIFTFGENAVNTITEIT